MAAFDMFGLNLYIYEVARTRGGKVTIGAQELTPLIAR
jgi:hypothetical protein